MSNTPKLADECKKLLDSGWIVTLWKNDLGSYSATATRAMLTPDALDNIHERQITDDFEPSQALYRLTEKVFGNTV